MESNKRRADICATSTSKKPCKPDHINMLRPEKIANPFIETSLRDASKNIMKYVTKELQNTIEFFTLDDKQKDIVLNKISDMIHTRCYDVMLNKIVCSDKHIETIYYKKYPKGKLDSKIMTILLETLCKNDLKSESDSDKTSDTQNITSESNSPTLVSKSNTSNYTLISNLDNINTKIKTDFPISESSTVKTESIDSTSNEICIPHNDTKLLSYYATSEHKNISIDNINMLRADNNPNEFLVTCLRNALKILEIPITKKVKNLREYDRYTMKEKKCIIQNVVDIIFRRCFNVMLNKIICGPEQIITLYYEKYPLINEVDEEIIRMLFPVTNDSSSAEMELDGTTDNSVDNSLDTSKVDMHLNPFIYTCYQLSVRDIMEYNITSLDAKTLNVFTTLSIKQKEVVLKNLKNIILANCKVIIAGHNVNGPETITRLHNGVFGRSLNEELRNMLKEIPEHPHLYEFESVDGEVLPEAEQINKIFSEKIDEFVKENFRKMITHVQKYEGEKHNILQHKDMLPNMKNIDKVIDKLDKNVNSKKDDIEERNDNNHQLDSIGRNVEANDVPVPDKYEQERKKLKEYYKIIDKILVPKIEDLIDEFRDILKNDEEYKLKQAEITLQVRNELDRYFKKRNKYLIENYIVENDDDDHYHLYDETNLQNDDIKEVTSENYYNISEVDSDVIDDDVTSRNKLDDEMSTDNNADQEIHSKNVVDEKFSAIYNELHENDAQINDSKDNVINQINVRNVDSMMEKERQSLVYQSINTAEPNTVFRVKLISLPDLPPKELILTFLNRFKTKTVKKHKIMKNLLVIDLNTEDDYSNILRACGTKLGSYTFLIRENETIDIDRGMNEKNENTESRIVENCRIDVREAEKCIKQEPSDGCNKEIDKGKNNDKVKEKDDEIDDKERSKMNSEKSIVNTSQEMNTDQHFVANLTAFPTLPSKDILTNFLYKFNPTTIKKHKKTDVLLITFNNKTEYENFLGTDGCRIGSSTFTILKSPLRSLAAKSKCPEK